MGAISIDPIAGRRDSGRALTGMSLSEGLVLISTGGIQQLFTVARPETFVKPAAATINFEDHFQASYTVV